MLRFRYKPRHLATYLVFLFAVALAAVALSSCSSGGGGDDSPSSSSGGFNPINVSCRLGDSCIEVPEEQCIERGGTLGTCQISSSSGSVETPSVYCQTSTCSFISQEACSLLGGTVVASCTSSGNDNEWPFDIDESLTPTAEPQWATLSNLIRIEYKNGSAPAITNPSSEVTSDVQGENVVIRIPDATTTIYNLVLSGATANGSLKIYGDVRKVLYLNGVNIKNNSGPAINIQKSKRVDVHLVGGKDNFLTDGGCGSDAAYQNIADGEQAKGTFFSEGKLYFTGGSGSLDVRGNCNHAIVVDNDFEIDNGKIIVSGAANDGIHANDLIDINGGIIRVLSTGDAIQSERLFSVSIAGGKIAARTTGVKSHGISSLGKTFIKGSATVNISVLGDGSKGIKSDGNVHIEGGTTEIRTSGTRHLNTDDDESNAAGIKANMNLYIDGGKLTVSSTGDKAKGINVAVNAYMSAGDVKITADDDGLKVHGNFNISGGTLNTESKKKKGIDAGVYNRTGGTVTFKDGN